MTCKDCLLLSMCRMAYDLGEFQEKAEKLCKKFKNKTDFVKVVRCNKCKYCNKNGFCFKNINGIGYKLVLPWDYCSYGKEKDTIEG